VLEEGGWERTRQVREKNDLEFRHVTDSSIPRKVPRHSFVTPFPPLLPLLPRLESRHLFGHFSLFLLLTVLYCNMYITPLGFASCLPSPRVTSVAPPFRHVALSRSPFATRRPSSRVAFALAGLPCHIVVVVVVALAASPLRHASPLNARPSSCVAHHVSPRHVAALGSD
jgi:hypothetical protein